MTAHDEAVRLLDAHIRSAEHEVERAEERLATTRHMHEQADEYLAEQQDALDGYRVARAALDGGVVVGELRLSSIDTGTITAPDPRPALEHALDSLHEAREGLLAAQRALGDGDAPTT